MQFSKPVTDLITERFSCRTYATRPLAEERRRRLSDAASVLSTGRLGSSLRFQLVATEADDATALKGLGTYGAIRDPAGFIVGAATRGGKYLEDYGYAMESLILTATDIGLGSCWLGGFFTRGTFSRRIALKMEERIPAVASVGEILDADVARDGFMRRMAGGARRLAAESLFFEGAFGAPLSHAAGPYGTALEMTRLAPSASNKQPWRVVHLGGSWHFYLSRTSGYRGGLWGKLLKIEDMQRVDIGIAMCHFELTLAELGVSGRWVEDAPTIVLPDNRTEYVVSWEGM